MPPLTPLNAAIRSQNVTASEVAALLDGHPYSTPMTIYDRLTAPDVAEREASQAMRIGSHFEATILRFAEAEYGFRARANYRSYIHPKVRLSATPDAFALTRLPWAMTPERALIEVKMSARAELWGDAVPSYIEWQARAQLACTGRDVVYVLVLAGMRLLSYPVHRDAGLEAQLLDAVRTFWTDHIVARARPVPAAPGTQEIEYRGAYA